MALPIATISLSGVNVLIPMLPVEASTLNNFLSGPTVNLFLTFKLSKSILPSPDPVVSLFTYKVS